MHLAPALSIKGLPNTGFPPSSARWTPMRP